MDRPKVLFALTAKCYHRVVRPLHRGPNDVQVDMNLIGDDLMEDRRLRAPGLDDVPIEGRQIAGRLRPKLRIPSCCTVFPRCRHGSAIGALGFLRPQEGE